MGDRERDRDRGAVVALDQRAERADIAAQAGGYKLSIGCITHRWLE